MLARPDWNRLYETAAAQQGHFTLEQAARAGYSRQLLEHHLQRGRILRPRRGIYRLVHFPPGEEEELTILWLWSHQEGVFSHQTALMLHDLSDALPSRIHLTVPESWRTRRLAVPPVALLHYGTIPPADRTWFGSVPVTRPLRTVLDCIAGSVAPDLVRQAVEDGRKRGLFSRPELTKIQKTLDTARRGSRR